MDTKKLYIKTQKNLLNWVVGISAITLISVVYSMLSKTASATPKYALWISFLVYLSLFCGSLYNRIKYNVNVARGAFYLYALFSVYSIIEMLLKYKATQQLLKLTQPNSNTAIFMIIGYAVGILFIVGINFLFYKSYKATQKIIQLQDVKA